MREGRHYIGETKKKEITFMLLKWEREREKVPGEFIAHISKGSNDDYGCIPRFAHTRTERERESWIWIIIRINERG